MTAHKLVPHEQLKLGHWYVGEGRLGPLAVWNGEAFMAPSYSLGLWGLDDMKYGSQGFSPYQEFVAAPDAPAAPEPSEETLERMVDASPIPQFCEHCGAGLGQYRRAGEGTCPECDPPNADDDLCARLIAKLDKEGRNHWWCREAAARIAALDAMRADAERELASLRADVTHWGQP